jgi:hypothetical protein
MQLDRFCCLVVRVPGYRTVKCCVSCEVRAEFIYVMYKKLDRLCGLVVRDPGYRTEMYCFLWGTKWMYILVCYVEESRPPLWSSGQSSWLQIQRPGFDSRRYQIFWVVGLERGPLSLMSTIEKLLERKSSSSGIESWDYGHRDPSRWPPLSAKVGTNFPDERQSLV